MKTDEIQYADVYWLIDDLDEYDIPKYKKFEIMDRIEEDLRDRMIERGWDFIHSYMSEHGYKRKNDEKVE